MRRPLGPGDFPPAPPAGPARRRLRDRVTLRAVALALVAGGVVTCLVPLGLVGVGMWQESQLTQSWARSMPARTAPPAETPGATPAGGGQPAAATVTATRPDPARAAFAIRVPKVGYYAAVREGVSMDLLAAGPGHYPTSAMPGRSGLVAIAAHNTFWIQFGRLAPGDTVILETRTGRFSYQVTGTKIVSPDDATVLVPTATPALVLTTCWPLWAGNLASQRLAIFARQV